MKGYFTFPKVPELVLYSHMQHHNNTIIKTQEDFLNKICTSHFIVRVCKGYSRFYGERELETKQNCNILTPHSYGRQCCVFLVLQGCSTGAPGAQLSAGWWLSLLHLITNFSGPQFIRGPKGPFGLVWLSLPHLISNFSGLQLNWPPPRVPSAWCGFSYHISSLTPILTVWLLSWPSYIIVQRPLNLWNGMFDCHQAEITVMQFRGHSLPVHQSMSASWDFLPCPISSANFRLRNFLS